MPFHAFCMATPASPIPLCLSMRSTCLMLAYVLTFTSSMSNPRRMWLTSPLVGSFLTCCARLPQRGCPLLSILNLLGKGQFTTSSLLACNRAKCLPTSVGTARVVRVARALLSLLQRDETFWALRCLLLLLLTSLGCCELEELLPPIPC